MARAYRTRAPEKLASIFLVTIVAVASFDIARQLALPHLPLWASHAITVTISAVVATVLASAVRRQFGRVHQAAAAYQQAEADRIGLTEAIGQASESVVITSAQGDIQYVNPAFTRMTGYSCDEVLGRNPRVLKSGKHPPEFYRDLWNTIIAGNIWRGELVNRRKDGSFYTEAMTITPVRDSHGKVCKFIAIKQDVTAQRAALDAQSYLASIVEATQDAILTTGFDGIIRSWNRGAQLMYGYPASEILGKPLLTLIAPEYFQKTHDVRQRLSRGELVLPFLATAIRKGGERFDVSVSVSPVCNSGGKIIGTAAIVRDMTAQKKAEQAIASLASIVESADDAIFSLTLEGIFLTWNQGAEVLWGYPAAEILGKHISVLVKPDRYAEQREVMESIRRGERVSNLETVSWTKDGQPVEVSVTVSPIRNAAGHVTGSSTIGRNISRRKRAEEALRRSEEKYRSLLGNLPDLVWTATENGRVTFSGGGWPGAQKFVGRELIHPGSFLKAIHPDDVPSVQTAFRELFVDHRPMDIEFRFKREDGSWAWLRNRSFATYEKEGTRYADGLLSDLSERKHMEERLAYHATHDALTDLPSRSIFDELLLRSLSHARRKSNSVALLHVDLDRFRVVNDTLGHATGDVLLQQVSRRLTACLRESEVPCRTGGDNFAVILPELDDPEAACTVAQRIIDALGKPFEIHGSEVFLSVNVGVALFPQHGNDVLTLKQSADSAMQLAKKLGKNRFQMFTVDMQAAATERLALECELHHALERGEFSVHYQPFFDLKAGRIMGAEALLRWHNPRFGQVSPAVFIPIAEESGLIVAIGAWVLRQACHQARLWCEAGFGSIKVAVNFSATQFAHGNLVGLIAHSLADAGLNGSCLVVEVTESVIMQDAKDSARQLAAIQKLGATVSLDDFGTGYSSLSYLGDLPINSLKIDRSFVQRLDDVGNSATLVQAISALAHSLDLLTVAEGVETQHQLDLLRSMHCDVVQGFFLAKPGPPESLTALLAERISVPPAIILAPPAAHPVPMIQ